MDCYHFNPPRGLLFERQWFIFVGGNIAAAWVALKALGHDGYTRIAKDVMEVTDKLKAGISNIQVG